MIFVLLQVLTPIHQAVGANLGDRTAAWLYDRLTEACVRPPGMGHLEDPKLTNDLTVARDFDLGMTGPPLSISMDFIAGGLVELIGGLASAVVLAAYAWWAPILLGGAWLSTHWLLRESAIWHDRNTDEVRAAQRDADYAYRLAVDPPASKELRLFGLVELDDRTLRRPPHAAARASVRGDPAAGEAVALEHPPDRRRECRRVLVARERRHRAGALSLGQVVMFAQSALGTAMIAFGGLNWALDGSAAPVAAVLRLEPAMAPAGALESGRTSGRRRAGAARSASAISRSRTRAARPSSPASTSPSPPGRRSPSSDRTAPARRRWPSCSAGSTTRRPARSRSTASTCASFELRSWRSRVTAVFQDFIRFELPLRDNVAPAGAPDAVIRAALESAGASTLAGLDTVLARGYEGGTELSGGQWQRIALARALCAVQLGAGVVLLDEPTAQLDVRGEAEIFDRILAATRHCTTILISHRFSTVRHADRICVLEHGRVVELGTHDELMAQGGRYRTMFDLQAQRFRPAARKRRDHL